MEMIDLSIKNLEAEIELLKQQLVVIDDTVREIQIGISENAISYGSRVLIEWDNNTSNEGRVVSKVRKDGTMLINRDGFAGTIRLGINRENVSIHKLKHLSVGTYGKLEKQQWILTQKIESKEEEMREILRKHEISLKLLDEILNLDDFKIWYQKNKYDNIIPYTKLNQSPILFRKACGNEFYIENSSKELMSLLTKYNP